MTTTPRDIAFACLFGSLSAGCIRTEAIAEFEGTCESGRRFALVHERRSVACGAAGTSVIKDVLHVSWYGTLLEDEASRKRLHGTAILLPDDASSLSEFVVRSEKDRIWLVAGTQPEALAAADFETREVFPNGSAQPPWATSSTGSIAAKTPFTPMHRQQGTHPEPFALRAVDGTDASLAQFENKIVVINFFGVACFPCRWEAPYLADLHSKYSDRGVVVIGINAWNDSDRAVEKYARELGLRFPVLLRGKQVAAAFGVSGVPTTVWLDRDGIVQFRISGFDIRDASKIDRITESMLEADVGPSTIVVPGTRSNGTNPAEDGTDRARN